jgi:hypothetical protein
MAAVVDPDVMVGNEKEISLLTTTIPDGSLKRCYHEANEKEENEVIDVAEGIETKKRRCLTDCSFGCCGFDPQPQMESQPQMEPLLEGLKLDEQKLSEKPKAKVPIVEEPNLEEPKIEEPKTGSNLEEPKLEELKIQEPPKVEDQKVSSTHKDFQVPSDPVAWRPVHAIHKMMRIERGEMPGDAPLTCFFCEKPVGAFRDALSKKEYTMSGMCQSCQNKTFLSLPEEDNYDIEGGEDQENENGISQVPDHDA